MARRQACPGWPAGRLAHGWQYIVHLESPSDDRRNGETGKSMRPSRRDRSMPPSGEADLVRFAPRDADSSKGICGQFGRNSRCAERTKLNPAARRFHLDLSELSRNSDIHASRENESGASGGIPSPFFVQADELGTLPADSSDPSRVPRQIRGLFQVAIRIAGGRHIMPPDPAGRNGSLPYRFEGGSIERENESG